MLGTLIKLLCARLLPLLVVALAVFLGWLSRASPIPEGTLFGMIYPIAKGYAPPIWTGGFSATPVPEVPLTDGVVQAYPGSYVELPHSPASSEEEQEGSNGKSIINHKMPQQGIGMCCRYTAYDPESVRRTILWYLKLGGRHIDTAGK